MRFGIYYNISIESCVKFFLNIYFLQWSLIEDLTGLFSPPPSKFLENPWTYL